MRTNKAMRYYQITMNVSLKQRTFYARSTMGHFDTLLYFVGDSLAGEYYNARTIRFYTAAGYAYVKELLPDEIATVKRFKRVNCK